LSDGLFRRVGWRIGRWSQKTTPVFRQDFKKQGKVFQAETIGGGGA
jgi:hypothetical protein